MIDKQEEAGNEEDAKEIQEVHTHWAEIGKPGAGLLKMRRTKWDMGLLGERTQ